MMRKEEFTFTDGEGKEIFVHKWIPEKEIVGVVQIAHGMAEHAARYEYFAEKLTERGLCVFANDHRGHGRTAVSRKELGYLGKDKGFDWMVEDMYELMAIAKKQYPNRPYIIFGHSMGSFLVQKYITMYGEYLDGAILSGTNGKAGFILNIGLLVARYECEKRGEMNPSERLNKLSFGNYNNSFKPIRTEFDWLSRNSEEVDKYIQDEYCGFVCSSKFFLDFLTGLKTLHKSENLRKIPKNLPIYIFAGDNDPVGGKGKGIKNLVKLYSDLGLTRVSYKLYEGGRHESLNEENRDEVISDTLKWICDNIKIKKTEPELICK